MFDFRYRSADAREAGAFKDEVPTRKKIYDHMKSPACQLALKTFLLEAGQQAQQVSTNPAILNMWIHIDPPDQDEPQDEARSSRDELVTNWMARHDEPHEPSMPNNDDDMVRT